MKSLIKKVSPSLPRFLRITLYAVYENVFVWMTLIQNPRLFQYVYMKNRHEGKKRILFYHPSGLSFGGTEKFLQIIAKYIDKESYDVYFMYSPKSRAGRDNMDGRKDYIQSEHIKLIPFDYTEIGSRYPYVITGAQPDFFNIIKKEKIDIVLTAGSGYSEYPFNILRSVPILLINIFGSPSTQKNIQKHICISGEVRDKILPVVAKEKTEVMYIQSELPAQNARTLGQKIRERFGIQKDDMVFGRIGRADNSIFDPIGIDAFKQVVIKYPDTHYIVMSAPPILVERVSKEHIPNVHFLEPSAEEEDVWAFHGSIDVLAHFRYDGESCGLNIAESMLAGNPIISHKSPIWNAHLEYLDSSFSRVAEMGNSTQYAEHMVYMINQKKDGKLTAMGAKAREKGEKLFYIKNTIQNIESIINNTIL